MRFSAKSPGANGLMFFFLQAADWPINSFLGMYCYFPVIRLVNFVSEGGPGYSNIVAMKKQSYDYLGYLRKENCRD